MNETPVTIIGNATADPELRFTASGIPVANFSVAVTPRTFNKDTNEWDDGTTAFYRITAWRGLAENVAEFVTRGKRLVVVGTIGQRNWEDSKTGDQRSSLEVTANEVGLALALLKPVTPEVETTSERPADKPKVERQNPRARKSATTKATEAKAEAQAGSEEPPF